MKKTFLITIFLFIFLLIFSGCNQNNLFSKFELTDILDNSNTADAVSGTMKIKFQCDESIDILTTKFKYIRKGEFFDCSIESSYGSEKNTTIILDNVQYDIDRFNNVSEKTPDYDSLFAENTDKDIWFFQLDKNYRITERVEDSMYIRYKLDLVAEDVLKSFGITQIDPTSRLFDRCLCEISADAETELLDEFTLTFTSSESSYSDHKLTISMSVKAYNDDVEIEIPETLNQYFISKLPEKISTICLHDSLYDITVADNVSGYLIVFMNNDIFILNKSFNIIKSITFDYIVNCFDVYDGVLAVHYDTYLDFYDLNDNFNLINRIENIENIIFSMSVHEGYVYCLSDGFGYNRYNLYKYNIENSEEILLGEVLRGNLAINHPNDILYLIGYSYFYMYNLNNFTIIKQHDISFISYVNQFNGKDYIITNQTYDGVTGELIDNDTLFDGFEEIVGFYPDAIIFQNDDYVFVKGTEKDKDKIALYYKDTKKLYHYFQANNLIKVIEIEKDYFYLNINGWGFTLDIRDSD